MKHYAKIALLALSTMTSAEVASAAPAAAPLPWVPPCTLARAVAEQLGRVAPQVKPLPNDTAFGAANGAHKVVVACGLSADETYTYHRLLASLGVDLLVFRGDEPPQKVVQELAGKLKLSFRRENAGARGLTYLFPDQGPRHDGVRLTVNAAEAPPASAVAAAKPAPPVAPAAAAARPAPQPAPPQSTTPPGFIAGARPQVNVLAAPTPTRPSASSTGSPAATAAPAGPPAEPVGPENLWDLYLLAKASDPELGRSQARYAGTQADTDVARSSFYPRVSAGFGLNYIDETYYNNPGAASTQTITLFGHNYSASASIPLLHVPSIYNLASAAASARSEDAGVSAAKQNLIAKLVDAYFGILKARADEAIAREEISRVRQALEQAQAFLKAGTGDIISVYEAQARLDSVIADLNRTESVTRIAEQRLSSIVGKPVATVADYLPRQPRTPEPEDIDWWLTRMEERDPQIKQARELLTGSELQTKSAKAEHLPTMDASAAYLVAKGNQFPPQVETHEWQIGATLTLPLYSGGETSARIRRAAANESERRYILDQVREQRRENVKQSYFNLTYNVSLVKALEQKEASSQIQLNAVRKGRSIGTRTAIDLLNAEQAYSVAQRDLKSALYDNVVRLVQLKAAAGILTEEDIAGAAGRRSP
ncbi:TolC family protein [Geomesophilobacter sediminis]|uniref:TolC family protein n=1 Tax=Geomesophilobacter sediminis TaxID=2798584 RepID=A0A8J7M2B5_9BACT|nr:TolC family protein [Geomesophilobacter sediminis]MBJ6727425.1 TolC family protein [Geomesophilobacter sediminis]